MPTGRKLKVFRTSIGFYDAYVAAPSQKAALVAWNAATDLFAIGSAEQVTDPKLMAAALERPGEVIRLSRGSAADHIDAAAKELRPRQKPRKTADARPLPKTAASERRRPSLPRPGRERLDQAERAERPRGSRRQRARRASRTRGGPRPRKECFRGGCREAAAHSGTASRCGTRQLRRSHDALARRVLRRSRARSAPRRMHRFWPLGSAQTGGTASPGRS